MTSQSPSRKPKGGYNTNKPKYLLPQLDGPLVTFRHFMEHQPDKVDKDKAQRYYNQYKEEWEQKQNQIFFLEHKEESWFMEKYDPILQYQYIQEKNQEAIRNAQIFFEDLNGDLFKDINLELTEEQLTTQLSSEQVEPQNHMENDKNYIREVYLKQEIDLTISPYYGFDQDKNTLFIRNIPKNLSRWDLKQHLEKLPGFLALSVSDPQKLTDYQRFGWVYLKDEESTNKSLAKMQQFMIQDTQFNVIKSQTGKKQVKVSKPINTEKALELTRDLIKALDREKQIKENPLLNPDLEDFNEKRLDLQLLYLRKVHSYCYLCGVLYNDERMLASKCSIQHIRIKSTDGEEEIDMNFPTWQTKVVEIAQKKVQEIEEKYGEMDEEEMEVFKKKEGPEEQIRELLFKKIEKRSSNNIFPCLFCDKKFKGANFVMKHLDLKHHEPFSKEFSRIREEMALENYSKDKFKLKPNTGMKGMMMMSQGFGAGRGGFNKNQKPKREKKFYKDLDAPQQGQQEAINTNNLVNYNDI